MRPGHPAFQSAVIGIDALYMESALAYPLAGARLHDVVGDALRPGKIGIDRSAIAAEHRLLVDQWQKRFLPCLPPSLANWKSGGAPTGRAALSPGFGLCPFPKFRRLIQPNC